jgi:hypothetical protein
MLFGLVEPDLDSLQRLAALMDYWVIHGGLRFAAGKFSSVPSHVGDGGADDNSVIPSRASHPSVGRLTLGKDRPMGSRSVAYLVIDRSTGRYSWIFPPSMSIYR